MNIKKDLLYKQSHEWLKVEDNEAYIGISEYAQNSMGDIVFVDLPDEDDEFKAKEDFAVVESVKAASDLYMPVDGKILEVNEEVMDDPALINSSPYDSWLVKIEIQDKSQLDTLLSGEDYEKYLNEEMDDIGYESKED
ncbi:glycine cleavage system protein GcvH [Dethiothermospora halolimnae]|uniref:glycine cleavage system protein GcvH n=1 Tax=Dethiothermospora halolimnae TaxID=3114390 RepID=UPI003CCBD512